MQGFVGEKGECEKKTTDERGFPPFSKKPSKTKTKGLHFLVSVEYL